MKDFIINMFLELNPDFQYYRSVDMFIRYIEDTATMITFDNAQTLMGY